MDETQLASRIAALAHEVPSLRQHLVPLLRTAGGGPFTGRGWTEHKKWLMEAKRATPVVVSPARAKGIMREAQAKASVGPWSDQIDRVISQGEHRYIKDVWMTMPGNKSFVNALTGIASGRWKLAADTALTGKTMENSEIRWHVFRSSIKVWDLALAGKRGKKVDGFSLYDIDMVRDPDVDKAVNQFAFRLRTLGFNKALAEAKTLVAEAESSGEWSPKFDDFTERGVDVAPAGFGPFEKGTKEFSVSADWTSYSARDRSDTYNYPACYNTGKRDVKRFYRWVTDNWAKLSRLTFNQLTTLMSKEGFKFRSYCSMD